MLSRTALLSLMNLTLLAAVGLLTRFVLAPSAPLVQRVQSETTASDPPIVRPASSIDGVLASPLFQADRKPVVDAVASQTDAPTLPVAEAVATPPAPLLTGVIKGSRGSNWALLEDESGTARQLVQAGQTFNEWTIEQIRPKSVRARFGDSTLELQIIDPARQRLPTPTN